jgi:hypothetical protein
LSELPRPSPLRHLALEYAEGRIARTHYEQERRRLLDALGAAPNPSRDTSAATPGVDAGPPTAEPDRGLASASPPPRPGAKRARWIAPLGAGLALPLAGALWYGLARDGTQTLPAVPSVPIAAPPPVAAPTTAAVGLIEDLLRADRLGPAERNRFLAAWRERSPQAQAQARASYAFQRLQEELVRLIESERATARGDSESQGLRDFAREMGIVPAPAPAPAPAPSP